MRTFAVLSGCLVVCGGCAFSGYSREGLSGGPDVAPGHRIEAVVETFGPPDKYIKIGDKEFLTYRTKSGVFVLLFGTTSAREVDFEFESGALVRYDTVPAGRSLGILTGQGVVAN